ncbi:MAG: adenylate kinase [Candidatus Komeilibacteria bacterium]
MKKIIIMGPPGSGKGTQAEKLAQYFNILHISTGEIFRDALQAGTALGKRIDKVMRSGQLVDDNTTNQIVAERLEQGDVQQGYVLDGYPRNINQAVALARYGQIDLAIDLRVRDTVVMKRLASRRHCEKCGRKYNLLIDKPQQENICDDCGGNLILRVDSQPEVIAERLVVYHVNNDPLVKYYEQQGLLLIIDGEPDIDTVWQNIKKSINL